VAHRNWYIEGNGKEDGGVDRGQEETGGRDLQFFEGLDILLGRQD
jgi:hypothetical protein